MKRLTITARTLPDCRTFTAKGRDVLTSACPKKVKDVEDAVRGR